MATNPIQYRIEKSGTAGQPYFVRIVDVGATPAKTLASSETYVAKSGALNMIAAVKAGQVDYLVFQGTDSRWYWHIKSPNSQLLARGAYHFGARAMAQASADRLKGNAAGGSTVDNA